LDARVRVTFPQGNLTEWYPQASRESGGTLEWKNLKIEPGTSPALPMEPAASRYYAARAVDAAPVADGSQHEKFLFYRGVGKFKVPISARVSEDGKIAISNRGVDPVPMMMLFENRGGHIGYRPAGALATDSVTLDRPRLDAAMPQLRSDLQNALIAAGLFPKEAQAMVETWRDSWFEEGSRLIYIVPAHTVDELLPLQVDPTPVRTTRVFVGRIELITPATMAAVQQAMAANDRSIVTRYGRFIDPILNRITARHMADATEAFRFRGSLQFPSGCR
jgi:hypothetical protein